MINALTIQWSSRLFLDSFTPSMSQSTDQESFFEATSKYWQRLFYLARTLVDTVEEAEDAVQDVFIKASAKQQQFEGKSEVYTWLVRILINHCKDHNRKKGRRETTVMRDVVDERQDVAAGAERSEDVRALLRATRTLESKYREVVLLRYFEDMSYLQIAEILEMAEGTVKSRLNTARRILRNELQRD